MSTEPSAAATPGIPEPSKEELEKRKLLVEIAQLQTPWYKQTQTWFNGGALLLALIGAYITIRFQAHQSDLKTLRAEIDAKSASQAVEEAKRAQQRAETDRDKAILDAKAAELRAAAAISAERKATAKLERVQSLTSQVTSTFDVTDDSKQARWAMFDLNQVLAEVLYDVTISPVDDATVSPTDESKMRVYEFRSDPPGMDVFVHTGKPPEAGERLVGKTPFRMPLPYGHHSVKFANEKGTFLSSVNVK